MGLLWTAPVRAQDAGDIGPGTRIRITTEEDRIAGTLVRLGRDSIVLEPDDQDGWAVAVRRSLLRRLEVSRGSRHAADGLMRGALFGLGIAGGLVATTFLVEISASEGDDGWTGLATSLVAGVVTPPLVVGGAIFGALAPGERWERISLRATLGRPPGRALGVEFGVRVRH